MSDNSPILDLPFILPAQAQKHVTHNEALALLDVLVQTVVTSRSLTAPPTSPAEGDVYIVPSGATGLWASQADAIAFFQGNVWRLLPPKPGWTARVLDGGISVVFGAAGWGAVVPANLQLDTLGISATADATNRLSVTSPAVLLNHAGAGHQLKINKAAPADTASLLFQTGFSGRAEMGLAGTDRFSVKVSANGSSFLSALEAEPNTGKVTLPQGAVINSALTGTAVTQSAIDTTPSRLLKVGDFGLGLANVGAELVANMSEHRISGQFRYDAATTGKPTTATQGTFVHLVRGADTASGTHMQTAYDSSGRVFTRAFLTGVWGVWNEVFHQSSIMGTVSQLGGVPTGALIERQSNANGEYVRHADGTQTCHHRIDLSSVDFTVSIGTTGFFASVLQTWTYPAAFATGPRVSGTFERPVDNIIGVVSLRSAPGTSSATYIPALSQSVNVTATRRVHLMAIGRWF